MSYYDDKSPRLFISTANTGDALTQGNARWVIQTFMESATRDEIAAFQTFMSTSPDDIIAMRKRREEERQQLFAQQDKENYTTHHMLRDFMNLTEDDA